MQKISFHIKKKTIPLLNMPPWSQTMQRTWWPVVGTTIATGSYCEKTKNYSNRAWFLPGKLCSFKINHHFINTNIFKIWHQITLCHRNSPQFHFYIADTYFPQWPLMQSHIYITWPQVAIAHQLINYKADSEATFWAQLSMLTQFNPSGTEAIIFQWPLLLTWFNFNPSMDK